MALWKKQIVVDRCFADGGKSITYADKAVENKYVASMHYMCLHIQNLFYNEGYLLTGLYDMFFTSNCFV